MRRITPIERVQIALGPIRNIALLTLVEPVTISAAMAQIMTWADAWPRFGMTFRGSGLWHRAFGVEVDPGRHLIVLDADDAPIEELLVATLTGAIDLDVGPWRVILINPADSDPKGSCRIIVHFDHIVADGMRFVQILSGRRGQDRQAADYATAAAKARRMSLAEFLRLPRDARINAPNVALFSTEIRNNFVQDDGNRDGATRRLAHAMTRVVGQVVGNRRPSRRCAAVAMTGRRRDGKANANTAVEVDLGPNDGPTAFSAMEALLSWFARRKWFMVAGQTMLAFLPVHLIRRLTANMATQWDGLLSLVPFGRRPLQFAGCDVREIWGLTVPVVPVPVLLIAVAYCNRFHMTVVTDWEWRGRADAFAEALESELQRADDHARINGPHTKS